MIPTQVRGNSKMRCLMHNLLNGLTAKATLIAIDYAEQKHFYVIRAQILNAIEINDNKIGGKVNKEAMTHNLSILLFNTAKGA